MAKVSLVIANNDVIVECTSIVISWEGHWICTSYTEENGVSINYDSLPGEDLCCKLQVQIARSYGKL